MPHTSGPRRVADLADVADVADVTGELVVDLEVRLLLVLPGEHILDPFATELAHPAAPDLVVEKVDDRFAVLLYVVRLDVHRGVLGGDLGLDQVERDDRQLERHVFHGLVHRRDVIERILRVGGQAEVRRRHHSANRLVRDPAGEPDVPAGAGPGPAGRPGRERSGPGQPGEPRLGYAEGVDDVVGGADDDVDAVLRTHHADV